MVESSAYRKMLLLHCTTTSSMKMNEENNSGPRMDPWSTEALIGLGNEDC